MRDFLKLAVLGAFLGFCCFDEEPFIDPSDWNIAHVLLLLLSLWAVVWENTQRARFGQFVFKDQVLLYAFLAFWWHSENYFRAVVIVFCLHSLTPLEVELFELTEAFMGALAWANAYLCPPLFLVSLCSGCGLLLNMSLGWGKRPLHLALTSLIVFFLFWGLFWLGWDLLFAGLSSYKGTLDPDLTYMSTASSLTYDSILGAEDSFDWHKEQTRPFVMRFDDFFGFTLQLFNVLALAAALYCWLFLLLDLGWAMERGRALSFTQLGVGLRWLDHLFVNLLACGVWPLFLSFRLILRTPFEFTFLS